MVIGVVPRYDPHGMGLPPPQVIPEGRRRAATVSIDTPREVSY